MNKSVQDHNKGLISTFFKAHTSEAYTEIELTRVRDVLAALGYAHKPVNPDEQDDFSHLIEDYIKTDEQGAEFGFVSLHLDIDGKRMVTDGRVCITGDMALKRLMGAATSVSMFAHMFQPAPTEAMNASISRLFDRQP